MANKSTKVFASGTVKWAKIVGDKALVSNYDGDGREWTFQFHPDDTSFLKEHKLTDRLKDKDDGSGPYLIIKKPEFNKDGEKNEPFRIYTEDNEPWDDRLIGNDSRVDVKIDIRDWGVGKKKSIYAAAIRVTDLVSYQSNEFAGMDTGKATGTSKEAAAPVKKSVTKKAVELDELDDDVPF